MLIACLGDSICFGDGVRREKAWVSLLGRQLPHAEVRNAGVNGDTAEGGLSRLSEILEGDVPGTLPDVLPDILPDILYVQFGLNDAWQQLPLERYLGAMREIVHSALSHGVGALLVATNHGVCVTEEQRLYGGEQFRENARRFNEALRDSFALPPERMILVDLEAVWDELDALTQERFLQEDGVHLSEAGNRWYEEVLEPFFRVLM